MVPTAPQIHPAPYRRGFQLLEPDACIVDGAVLYGERRREGGA